MITGGISAGFRLILFWPTNLLLYNTVGSPDIYANIGVGPASYGNALFVTGIYVFFGIPSNGIGWGFIGFLKVLFQDILRDGFHAHRNKVVAAVIIVGLVSIAVYFRGTLPSEYAHQKSIKTSLRKVISAQRTYHARHQKYCGSIYGLQQETGDRLVDENVRVFVLFAGKYNFEILAYHLKEPSVFMTDYNRIWEVATFNLPSIIEDAKANAAHNDSISTYIKEEIDTWVFPEAPSTPHKADKDIHARREELLLDLKFGNLQKREAAVRLLAEDHLAIEPLIDARAETDADFRFNAVRALPKIRDQRVIESLEKSLKDEDIDVRRAAAKALDEIQGSQEYPRRFGPQTYASLPTERLIQDLRSKFPQTREQAVKELFSGNANHDLEPWMRSIADTMKGTTEWAVQNRSWLRDEQVADLMIKVLKDGNPKIRKETAAAPGEFKDPQMVRSTRGKQIDKDDYVRSIAALALGHSGEIMAFEPLIAALDDNKSATVRGNAASALGKLGDKRVVEPLIQALKDDDGYVRQHAADALADFKDDRAFEALVEALKDNVAEVRRNAAIALGALNDARAIGPLRIAAQDENLVVRIPANHALRKLEAK